jgi:hypothetical protein
MSRAVAAVVTTFIFLAAAARAQSPAEITPSKDFPKGTATPSADCGACHQAIYREYADGFGSDMKYPAPWYGPRPDDRAFLKEDEKRPDRVAATQADEQGPHEAPIRAGEERVLTWEPKVRGGRYTVEATLVYDLNRYNDRSFKGDQREISRFTLPLQIEAGR